MTDFQPLCFGLVTAYAEDSEKCKNCGHAGDCGQAVHVLIQELREKYNVEATIRQHVALRKSRRARPVDRSGRDLSRPQAPATPTVKGMTPLGYSKPPVGDLLKETREAVATLRALGDTVAMRNAMVAGQNPFGKDHPAPFIIARLLVAKAATASNINTLFERAGINPLKGAAYRSAFVNLRMAEYDGPNIKL